MNKSPIFNVIQKVLNRVEDEEPDEERGWIDHYIQLADKLLKRARWSESPLWQRDDEKKAA